MQGTDRKLVHPPVSSREAFAELDARRAAEQDSDRRSEIRRLGHDDEQAVAAGAAVDGLLVVIEQALAAVRILTSRYGL